MSASLVCWNCGAALDGVPQPISRHEHCQKCSEALHCCRLCRHFDAASSTRCTEDRAEPPTNKESANFCEWFAPRGGAHEGPSGGRQADARAKLDALFGGNDD
jgi:hypothetical protein